MPSLRQAFKEWSAICAALATGRQAILLRKGGIAEVGGRFTVDHDEFWLLPTFQHQSEQPDGLKPEFRAEGVLPRESFGGIHRLTYFARVTHVAFATELEQLRGIETLHAWSEGTVQRRFHYRVPGLHVVAVRVYQANVPREVPHAPEIEGCRTWVDLGTEEQVEGIPVLADAEYIRIENQLAKAFSNDFRTPG